MSINLLPSMIEIFNKITNREFLRFGIIGLLANIIYFLIYISLYKTGLHIFIVSIISYSTSLFFTFHLSKNWTFNKTNFVFKKNIHFHFGLVYFSSAIIMSFIITMLVNNGIDYIFAWFVGACYAIMHNYLLSKFYIFS